MVKFYCPKCGEKIAANKDFYFCERCDKQWPIKEEIGLFCESKYWGEVGQKEMNEILETVQDKGMEKTLKLIKEKDEYSL